MVLIYFKPQIQAWFSKRAETKTELKTMEADSDRQDEVALWSSMVHLQTQSIEQNKKLLDVIINSVDGQLKEIAQTIRDELVQIEGRWIEAIREITEARVKIENLTVQVTSLSDDITRLAEGYQEIECKIDGLAVVQSSKENT